MMNKLKPLCLLGLRPGQWLMVAGLGFLFLGPNTILAVSNVNRALAVAVAAVNLLTFVFTAYVCWSRSRREPEAWAGWLFGALTAGTASLCQFPILLAALTGRAEPSYPEPLDWASLVALPIGGIALLLFPLRPSSLAQWLRLGLDSLLFAVSLLFLLFVVVYDSDWQLEFAVPRFRDATVVHVSLVVLDLAIVLFLVRADPACLRGPLALLTVGLAFNAMPPLLALRQVVAEQVYARGHAVELFHSAALLCLCTAALHPWPIRPASRQLESALLKYVIISLPYLPFAGMTLVSLWILSGNPLVIWGGAAAVLLLIVRLTLALYDYWALTRTLEEKVRERSEQLQASQTRNAQTERLEALGRLAGGVAHDFNNLLTAILGYAELLQSRLPPQEECRAHAQEIGRVAERAAALTRQLLTFARKQPNKPIVFDPAQVIADLHKLLERTLGEDIALEVRGAADLWRVRMDPHQFEQVILNLAINARDAMPGGGALLIEMINVSDDQPALPGSGDLAAGPHVRVRIRDTGTGISQEALGHIFDPFFSTKGPGKGTGLGLPICYSIVQQAGGQIAVATEVGRGTTFDVLLPRCTEPLERRSSLASQTLLKNAAGVILVAEDEASLRRLLGLVLNAAGFEAVVMANASEAVAYARSHPGRIDLFLTDMVMPGGSGLSAAREVSACHPETKILVMSGYAADATEIGTIVAERIPFVQKPISPATLVDRVRELIGG